MSIVSYSLINKLYQGSREQALQDILHRYFSQAYCIVDYVYGFMVVNRMLLEQKAQTITTANRDLDFREIMMDVDFLLPDGAALRVLWLV